MIRPEGYRPPLRISTPCEVTPEYAPILCAKGQRPSAQPPRDQVEPAGHDEEEDQAAEEVGGQAVLDPEPNLSAGHGRHESGGGVAGQGRRVEAQPVVAHHLRQAAQREGHRQPEDEGALLQPQGVEVGGEERGEDAGRPAHHPRAQPHDQPEVAVSPRRDLREAVGPGERGVGQGDQAEEDRQDTRVKCTRPALSTIQPLPPPPAPQSAGSPVWDRGRRREQEDGGSPTKYPSGPTVVEP